MLGSLTELIAYASRCWVSCQWLVSKLTFLMKVINGNCLSCYSGNLLIAETCKYHKGCGGQWLIMDGICWMTMPSAENTFSGLGIFVSPFPNLERAKSGGERSRAEAVPPPSQTCTKRGGEGAGILSLPFIPPPLSQLAGLGGGCFLFPTSFSAGWGKAGRQQRRVSSLPRSQVTTWASGGREPCSRPGARKVTSTFHSRWNKVRILSL